MLRSGFDVHGQPFFSMFEQLGLVWRPTIQMCTIRFLLTLSEK
jgi:hypothetical protein